MDLELKVLRKQYLPTKTIGEMYCNGAFFCYTLEDKVRKNEPKVMHETAIPSGKYKVIIDKSTRFKREMPHILDVKDFSGIRIHSGNLETDTDGCILVGFKKLSDRIYESKDAFNKLFVQMKLARNITIEVIDA